MIKKLTKHGNSLALVIEKSILDLLGWTATDEYEITTDGKRLIIKRELRESEIEVVSTGLAAAVSKRKLT